jgi:hypothetical protein
MANWSYRPTGGSRVISECPTMPADLDPESDVGVGGIGFSVFQRCYGGENASPDANRSG